MLAFASHTLACIPSPAQLANLRPHAWHLTNFVRTALRAAFQTPSHRAAWALSLCNEAKEALQVGHRRPHTPRWCRTRLDCREKVARHRSHRNRFAVVARACCTLPRTPSNQGGLAGPAPSDPGSVSVEKGAGLGGGVMCPSQGTGAVTAFRANNSCEQNIKRCAPQREK